jgi:hypothetical protein
MAELRVEGDELVLHLSAAEKIEGVHGNLRVHVSAVWSVEILEHAHDPADLGFKVGTRIPGVIEVGTMHGLNKKIFAAVHYGTPRGVRILLQGAAQDEWIVGCDDPEAVAASIRAGR